MVGAIAFNNTSHNLSSAFSIHTLGEQAINKVSSLVGLFFLAFTSSLYFICAMCSHLLGHSVKMVRHLSRLVGKWQMTSCYL